MVSNKRIDFTKIEISGTATFKEQLFFLNKKNKPIRKTLLKSNVTLKIYRKIKERNLVSENLVETLKLLMGI